jgi:uncharacterized membrane protein
MLILPWAFTDMMRTALLKLQIAPQIATLIVAGILMGSLINVPVKRVERQELMPVDPFPLFGLGGFWHEVKRARRETIVAVNVGGCVIPASPASYEALLLARGGAVAALTAALWLSSWRQAWSVGGAGTFDGIILSGIVALYLA